MAAKKLQDYVKGKMSTSNVGSIHFSSNSSQDKNLVNISKFQQSLDDKDFLPKSTDQEFDIINSVDQKLPLSAEMNDDNSPNTQTPSSTKSSPDSKPKWGSHIEDVKKNINNAVEDAYSAINTLLKDHINKPETRLLNDQDNATLTEKPQQPTIRASKTMSNIDKVTTIFDSPNEVNTYNKSLDNLTMDTEALDIAKPQESDSVDFKWMPTPKNIKNRSKPRSQKSMPYIPKKVQESLIDNHQFPTAKISSSEVNVSSIKWTVIMVSSVVLISMIWSPAHLVIGYILGLLTCLLFLYYCGWLNQPNNERIVSLPALKDLMSPSIPHIQQENVEDFDLHATENSLFSGWMNLLFTYDINTYNINHSYVVHINIEDGKQLRIRRPKRKIARRAMWNESQYHSVSFSSEIIVNLDNAIIELLPSGLVKKRLWSKKYPICIELPKPLEEYSIEKSAFDLMNPKSTKLYLFGRTCREKEEWFRRLSYASSNISMDLNMWNIVQNYLTRKKTSLNDMTNSGNPLKQSDPFARPRSFTAPQTEDESKKVTYHHMKEDDENQEPVIETHKWKQENKIPKLAEFVKYMSKFMPADMFLLATEVMRLDINYVTCNPEIVCINAFLGRLFWDFLRGSHWVGLLRNKIQCKLKKMHLPQFIDQLTVVDIHLGKEIPIIRKFSRPYLDSRGLWFDAEVAYTGGMSMILETKINLFNLKNQLRKVASEEASGRTGSPEQSSEPSKEYETQTPRSQSNSKPVDKTAAFASSEEDSAESSSNSEESGDERPTTTIVANSNAVGGGGSSKRIIRWVDKIARSPYFIKAADNKYVQRGMELVSNTKLMLQVEVHSVSGTLALNIPPPPSDRLWYGFRPSPIIRISAKPKVGQKEISITKITELIEKKLILEFQKILVLPNMDDVALPLLINGNPDDYRSNL